MRRCCLHLICSRAVDLIIASAETFSYERAAEIIIERSVMLTPASLCSDGPLELHTLSLLPSQRQVVFKGDRLPFHCTAALVDKRTTLHWHHNGQLVMSDSEMDIQLEKSVVHDCIFITRYRCPRFIVFIFRVKRQLMKLNLKNA